MKRLTCAAGWLAALAVLAGCDPTGTPPKPKAGEAAPKAATGASASSQAPRHDASAQVFADADMHGGLDRSLPRHRPQARQLPGPPPG